MKKQMSGSLGTLIGRFYSRHAETLRAASSASCRFCSRHPELVSGSRRCESGEIPNQAGIFACQKSGFTLIELLVVVLIIGILAAVAVPQYEKAVWKSRVATLRPLMKSVAEAQNVYFMANDTYAESFGELAVDVDSLTIADKSTLGAKGVVKHTDTVRYNDLFEIYLDYRNNVVVWFRTGKYKGCGLWLNYETGEWSCREWYHYYQGVSGGFCKKIMSSGALYMTSNDVRHYLM